MNQRWIAAGLLAVCAAATTQVAEAGKMFRFMENKGHNVHFIGPRLPFATFDNEYYHTRYPFNRYYNQQAHSYNGYPEYNR